MTQHLVRYRRPAKKTPPREIDEAIESARDGLAEEHAAGLGPHCPILNALHYASGEAALVEIVSSDAELAADLREACEFEPRSASQAVHTYLHHLAEGASRDTMTGALDKIVGLFSDFLGVPLTRETLPWHRLTPAATEWLRSRLAKTLAPTSANLHLCALRGVLVYCNRTKVNGVRLMSADDLLDAKPEGVKGSRAPKGRALSKPEIDKLFAACEPAPDEAGVRDRALLALLYGLGLRLAEVAALDVEKLEDGSLAVVGKEQFAWLRVLGKGNDERMMPTRGSALRDLNAYLDIRRGEPSGPMFLHLRGSATRLGRSGITQRVKALAERAGVKCAVHDLRRSFCTTLLRVTGSDYGTVGKLMGHKHVSTTMIYDMRGEEEKQAVIKKLPEWE